MDLKIIDQIDFEPDLALLKQRLRIRPGTSFVKRIEKLAAEAEAIAHPRALYRQVTIENNDGDTVTIENTTFSSRVLSVNLAEVDRAILYVATGGTELQSWTDSYEDMLLNFYAAAIAELALREATCALERHLIAEHDLAPFATMHPGSLPDWPIQQQRPLFGLLGDTQAAIGVKLTDSYLMKPEKSVSGIIFHSPENFASCMLCPKEDCPERQAPYDPELYDTRYQRASRG